MIESLGLKIQNGSRDHDHASFRGALSSVGSDTVNLCTKSEDRKGDAKVENGVVWGSYGYSSSLEIAPFNRTHTSSC